MEFKRIRLEDKKEFDRIVGTKKFKACEYHFSHLFIWRNTDDIRICMKDDMIFIRENRYKSFMLPIADDMDKAVSELKKHCEETNEKFLIMSAFGDEVRRFEESGLYNVTHKDDYDDYIYNAEELIALDGHKYHAKRNHITKFLSLYDYTIEKIDASNSDDCLEMDDKWIEKVGGGDTAREELVAIEGALEHMEQLGLCGLVLRINGEIAGFSIGERADDEMGIVHFEKGNTDYTGIYTAINNIFAREYFKGLKYINREDDMGLENLKKAKLSYYPCEYAEKYEITLK